MKMVSGFLSLLIVTVMLTSCSIHVDNKTDDPPKITIETYKTAVTTTETTAEPAVTTTPPTSFEESTTASTEAPVDTTVDTEATTVPTTEPAVELSSEATEYEIVNFDGVMFAVSSVNVRSEPDADSERIGHLDEGEKVKVTGIVSNGWIRIEFKNGEYFVNGRYLTDIFEEEVTTEATNTEISTSTTATTTITTESTSSTTTEYESDEEIIEDELDNVVVGSNSYKAMNYSNQKAIWFAYLDIDSMLSDASEAEFRNNIRTAFMTVSATGFNTVYVHVRAFGDAYYFSDYYDFTAAYSGKMGKRPDYDPLDIMIEEAHSLGLSFHAWINPMRTTTKERFEQMNDDYQLKKWYDSRTANGTYLVYNSKTEYYWLSPAYPAVRELICNGVAELVTNYNVDAVHIDDYFYPTTSASFDEAAYKADDTDKTLSDWRRGVVSILVKEMYQTVKSCNASVLFGISPAGNTKNNYESYYADIFLWGSTKGYCDYMVPQIYYGFEDKLPYDTTVAEWMRVVSNPSVDLVCGIAAYKVGLNDEWSSGSMIRRQVDLLSEYDEYDGYALYRYGSIFKPADDVVQLMSTELMNLFR